MFMSKAALEGCDKVVPSTPGSRTPDPLDIQCWLESTEGGRDTLEAGSGLDTPKQDEVAKVLVSHLHSRLRAVQGDRQLGDDAKASGGGRPREAPPAGPCPWKVLLPGDDDLSPAFLPPPPAAAELQLLGGPRARRTQPPRPDHTSHTLGLLEARGLCPYGAFQRHAGTGGAQPDVIVSVGTVGHPETCAEECVDPFCRLGAACPRCHLCRARSYAGTPMYPTPIQPQPPAQTQSCVECPSAGSVGHPHNCAEPCKYHTKNQNCKDGSMCVRCHLCRWRRSSGRQPVIKAKSTALGGSGGSGGGGGHRRW